MEITLDTENNTGVQGVEVTNTTMSSFVFPELKEFADDADKVHRIFDIFLETREKIKKVLNG